MERTPDRGSGAGSNVAGTLVDTFGRTVRKLRISVTDRCNFRCQYCLPVEPTWLPRADILTFEEIERTVRLLAPMGIRRLRLTGGEPLLRRELPTLTRRLRAIPGIESVAMTTNGYFLREHAAELRAAGLDALTVSLDALDAAVFERLVRRPVFDRVMQGIAAAGAAGFAPIKINCVAMRGGNDDQLLRFAELARSGPFVVRFIEYMPLDSGNAWEISKVIPASEVRQRISERWPLQAVPGDGREPAQRWVFADGVGEIGFIASVTEPFCGSCDRIRVTADGKLLNCLFATTDYDLRALLRSCADDAAIRQCIGDAVRAKAAGHLINQPNFVKPARAMAGIGG